MEELIEMAEQTAPLCIALGGHALKGIESEPPSEFIRGGIRDILRISQKKFNSVVLTHGNGPQVGHLYEKQGGEISLDTCVAQSQGWLGYRLQQVLQNEMNSLNHSFPITTLLTQVLVDCEDPAFSNPTKQIGASCSEEQAKKYITKFGWTMKTSPGRGLRRVVASPIPTQILEVNQIQALISRKGILVCCGGGGIPVAYDKNQKLVGLEAVIDKDETSSLLAKELKVEVLLILTDVPHVFLHYEKPNQTALTKIKANKIHQLLGQGHFAEGSMAPKIRAALKFLDSGGKRAIVAEVGSGFSALMGEGGTQIEN